MFWTTSLTLGKPGSACCTFQHSCMNMTVVTALAKESVSSHAMHSSFRQEKQPCHARLRELAFGRGIAPAASAATASLLPESPPSQYLGAPHRNGDQMLVSTLANRCNCRPSARAMGSAARHPAASFCLERLAGSCDCQDALDSEFVSPVQQVKPDCHSRHTESGALLDGMG